MPEKSRLTRLAQTLRKGQTKEERKLWYQYLNQYPVRFRRQHPIGCYIADFYCGKAKLVIELDESQHYQPDEAERDAVRTEFLESLELQVLRFSNGDVCNNFEGVCLAIDEAVQKRIDAG